MIKQKINALWNTEEKQVYEQSKQIEQAKGLEQAKQKVLQENQIKTRAPQDAQKAMQEVVRIPMYSSSARMTEIRRQ